MKVISLPELQSHNSEESCWIGLNGHVYDITDFLSKHPGGGRILLKNAGKDATDTFDTYHPDSILNILPPASLIGKLDTSFPAIESTKHVQKKEPTPSVDPLGHVLNTYDFARNAKKVLPKEAWDYLVSAADDEVTYKENEFSFNRVWIKPRVLVNVAGSIDTSVSLFGTKSHTPIYISATAMGGLYHREAEVALCRGANRAGVIQMCPTLASSSIESMAKARAPAQVQWFQLYVNNDRAVTERLIRQAESLGFSALAITVDVAVLGKRERDQRNKVSDISNVQKALKEATDESRGVSRSLSSFISPALDWAEIAWMRKVTKMPILLKGIQTKEDAILAYKSGIVQGIIVSNHGGRQVDFARPTVVCLQEIVSALKSEKGVRLNANFDVYVDGGIRRGSDIFKCLAMGAKAVGIGRPPIFALASHGEEGVHHLIDLLTEELRVVMMHTGCRKLADIRPEMISTNMLAGVIGDRYNVSQHESKL